MDDQVTSSLPFTAFLKMRKRSMIIVGLMFGHKSNDPYLKISQFRIEPTWRKKTSVLLHYTEWPCNDVIVVLDKNVNMFLSENALGGTHMKH